jgi:signal peptidase I
MDDKKSKIFKEIRSWVLVILGAFFFAFLINSEVLAKVIVDQSSMENTLFTGQQLFVDVASYHFEEPKQGDIIIFFPNEEKGNLMDSFARYIDGYRELFTKIEYHERYVKRVIGVAGDTVDIKDDSVYINGEKLEEPYVNGITEVREFEVPYTVKEGELFVMGDNRDVSMDSRAFGPISLKQVEGRAFFRVYPFGKMGNGASE